MKLSFIILANKYDKQQKEEMTSTSSKDFLSKSNVPTLQEIDNLKRYLYVNLNQKPNHINKEKNVKSLFFF